MTLPAGKPFSRTTDPLSGR